MPLRPLPGKHNHPCLLRQPARPRPSPCAQAGRSLSPPRRPPVADRVIESKRLPRAKDAIPLSDGVLRFLSSRLLFSCPPRRVVHWPRSRLLCPRQPRSKRLPPSYFLCSYLLPTKGAPLLSFLPILVSNIPSLLHHVPRNLTSTSPFADIPPLRRPSLRGAHPFPCLI